MYKLERTGGSAIAEDEGPGAVIVRSRKREIIANALFYSALSLCVVLIVLDWIFKSEALYLLKGIGVVVLFLLMIFGSRPRIKSETVSSSAQFVLKHFLLIFMLLAQLPLVIIIVTLILADVGFSTSEALLLVLFYEITVPLLLLIGKHLGLYLQNRPKKTGFLASSKREKEMYETPPKQRQI